METITIALVINSYNHNSFAALMAALDVSPAMSNVFFEVVSIEPKENLEEKLKKIAEKNSPVILAFSFSTCQLIPAAKMIQRAKNLILECICAGDFFYGNIVLVGGGPHPSGAPLESLLLGLDYVVVGEGEVSFPHLVAALWHGDDPEKISGVASLKNKSMGKKKFSYSAAPSIDFNAFPCLAPINTLFSPLEIARGCYQACHFCQTSYLFGASVRYRSIENITNAAQFAFENNRKDIRFICSDALSYGSKDKIQNLDMLENMLKSVHAIVGREHLFLGTFPSEIWPASVNERGLEIIQKYCGNDTIVVGTQSGSQAMLDKINRRHTLEDVVLAVKLIAKFQFTPIVDFIFGFPDETKKEQEESIAFMRKLADLGATIHAHAFIPLVGSPMANAKPCLLPEKTVSMIEKLIGEEKLFGTWQKQHTMAHKIYEFRKQLNDLSCIDSLDEKWEI